MNLLDDLSAWLGFGKSRLRVLMARWIAAKVRVAYAKPSMAAKTWDDLRAADRKAGEDVTSHVVSTMAVADLLGRRRTIIEAEDATGRKMRRLPVPVTTIGGKPKGAAPAAAMPEMPPAPPTPEARALEVRIPDRLVVRGDFREAVEDLLSRNPKLAVGYAEVAAKYAKGHVFALAKSTDETLTRRVQALVAAGIKAGTPPLSVSRAISELGGWTENYSETVFHTNAATAYTSGRFRQARDPDIAAIMPAFELLGRTVPPSRPNHAAAVGLVAARDDPVWGSFMPPLGYNGIAPWVRVSGAFVAGSKSRYTGPLVEVHTRQGTRLTVTGNHPVLTLRGWKRADDVREGDDLVRDLLDVEPLAHGSGDRSLSAILERRRAVDDEQGAPCAADAFETLCAKRMGTVTARTWVAVSPLDFHGDGRFMDEEIEVVGAYVPLPRGANAARFEGTGEFDLMLAAATTDATDHRASTAQSFIHGMHPTARRIPCTAALLLDDFAIAPGGACYRPSRATRLGLSARFHPAGSKPPEESPLRRAAFATELLYRFSREVATDEVIQVRRLGLWSGHVYDFQTTAGWMVAESVCISNCTHVVRLVDRVELRRRGLLREDGSVIRYEPPDFANAYPDPGFGRGGLAARFGFAS